MAWEYSEKTKNLFMDAIGKKDGTHIGELKDADGEGFHGSLVCGDAIKLTFKTKKDPSGDRTKDVIIEVKYLTFGCTSAIAASEALCFIIEGKKLTPIQALNVTKDDIVTFLEGLPTQKIHCSIMGVEALHSAVADWAKKAHVDLNKMGIKLLVEESIHQDSDDRTVCQCMGHTKKYIKDQIIDLGLKSVEQVVDKIKTGSVCGGCIDAPGGIKDIFKELYGKTASEAYAPNKKDSEATNNEPVQKTPYQITKEIEKVLTNDIIPVLERDGGGLDIIDIKDMKLFFRLRGACKGCAGASMTSKYTIEDTLKKKVDPRVKAISVD